uniref:ATP-dependent RNA helicase n=1 Tax=Panagrolaimus sp. JU765 TaxID=591449 RepID=A0AC34QVM0_9BILA
MSLPGITRFEKVKPDTKPSPSYHVQGNIEDINQIKPDTKPSPSYHVQGNNEDVNQSMKSPLKYDSISVKFNNQQCQLVDIRDFTTAGIRPLPHFLEYTYEGVDFYRNSKELGIEVLKPVQYNIFKLLMTDFSGPMKKANIVIETPNGTGKTIGILLTLIEMAMKRIETNDKRAGTPLALIFVHTNLLGAVLKQRLDDLIAGGKIKTAFFASRQREVCRFDFDIAICTAGTFFNLFKQKERHFQNLEFVVVDEADVFFEDFDNIKNVRRLLQNIPGRLILSSATSNPNNFNLRDSFLNKDKFIITSPPNNFMIPKFVEVNCDKRSRIVGLFSGQVICKASENEVLNPFDHLYLILKQLFQKDEKTSVVVYCKNGDAVDVVARKLWLLGFNAASVHGDSFLNKDKFIITSPPNNFLIPKFVEVNCDKRSRVVGLSSGQVVCKASENEVLNPFDHLYLILKQLFQKDEKTSVVVYCKNGDAVDVVARKLWLLGFNAASVHGNQVLELQVPVLQAFYERKLNILVGCRLISRGFDLPVSTVINYHLPSDMRSYLNRCGRIDYLGGKGQIYTFLHLASPRRPEEYSPIVISSLVKQTKFCSHQMPNFDEEMIAPFFRKEIALFFDEQAVGYEPSSDELSD